MSKERIAELVKQRKKFTDIKTERIKAANLQYKQEITGIDAEIKRLRNELVTAVAVQATKQKRYGAKMKLFDMEVGDTFFFYRSNIERNYNKFVVERKTEDLIDISLEEYPQTSWDYDRPSWGDTNVYYAGRTKTKA